MHSTQTEINEFD